MYKQNGRATSSTNINYGDLPKLCLKAPRILNACVQTAEETWDPLATKFDRVQRQVSEGITRV